MSATVVPLPATTVAPTATFTIFGAVVTGVAQLLYTGRQNTPAGPGAAVCKKCDLARLITQTCCGTGGSVSNPIEISAGVPLWRHLVLPAGFVPNQEIGDMDGVWWPAGRVLPWEIVIPKGRVMPFDFEIRRGLSLSDRYSGAYKDKSDGDDDNDINMLYVTSTFWSGPHTVTCDYPCTLVFPPTVTRTTWTPPTLVTTVTPGVASPSRVRLTVTSPTGSTPTRTMAPVPAPDPLCIQVTLPILGAVKIGLCPPDLEKFPPPLPPVTIVPVPPGGTQGPINPSNLPGGKKQQAEEKEDEEEEEEGEVCLLTEAPEEEDIYEDTEIDTPWDPVLDPSGTQPGSPWYTMSSSGSGSIGAGTGKPQTETVTVTVRPPRTSVTSTVTDEPTDAVPPPKQRPPRPPRPVMTDRSTEVATCFSRPNREVFGSTVQAALDNFCEWADGTLINDNSFLQVKAPGDFLSNVVVSVQGRNDCAFIIHEDDCKRIFNKVVGCRPGGSLLRIGGKVESNCATWILDPVENLKGECIPIPIIDRICKLINLFAP